MQAQITQEQITSLLSQVLYPNFQKDIVSYGFVKEIKTTGDSSCEILIAIPSSDSNVAKALHDRIDNTMEKANIHAKISIQTPTPQNPAQDPTPKGKNLLPQVKHFIMVSSGKGGVGKSSVATNLAIALAMEGKKVGLLDADIYGPNIPRMFGVHGQKPNLDPSGKKLIPLHAYGVDLMSMGMLFDEGESLIWRGPMLMRAIVQMFSDVVWGDLDIMVLDMPPGTGDAQLSIAQNIPVSAGVAITTPQLVSLDDGARALDMFVKLSIPIAGIVENMSSHICANCGCEQEIFGKDTTLPLAQKYNTQVIAKIPLDPSVREGGDNGKPVVYFAPDSAIGKAYRKMAHTLLEFLAQNTHVNNSTIQPR